MAKNNSNSDDLRDLPGKIDKVLEEVDQRISEVMKKVDEKVGEITGESRKKTRKVWDNTFWGVVLLLVGFFWLGNNLDWFRISIPFWPVVLIVIGLYLLLENRHR